TTVGADQAITVAVAKLDRDIFEEGFGPELHGDVGCRDQNGLPMVLKQLVLKQWL
ncbi:MAG: hypothetical protein FD130_2171, partial [Halothiobacillaceae bacterium]